MRKKERVKKASDSREKLSYCQPKFSPTFFLWCWVMSLSLSLPLTFCLSFSLSLSFSPSLILSLTLFFSLSLSFYPQSLVSRLYQMSCNNVYTTHKVNYPLSLSLLCTQTHARTHTLFLSLTYLDELFYDYQRRPHAHCLLSRLRMI